MRFALTEDREGAEARAVRENLGHHRARALGGAPAHRPLVLSHHAADGRLMAGLVAEVVLDWLFVETFWVDESLRGQGIGGAMLAQAEAAARERGAVGVHLYTSSFQAPDFYRRHGFTELGSLAGRPAGHSRFWFGKRFDGGDPRAG